jgi:hypothetical protein
MFAALDPGGIRMGAGSLRAFLSGAFIVAITGGAATGQTAVRPPVGGIGQLPDAMIFYIAHGPEGACGPHCSDWIAAEGAVKYDTHKRLIAILDRQGGRKLPLVINARGESNLNVAVSLGRILRDRGIDTTEGVTEVTACAGKEESDCFALKRPGGPLEARLNVTDSRCDLACVLILAGGVHRSLPPDARVILSGMTIYNRLGLNVSEEQREGASIVYDKKIRLYLTEMGVGTELLDIVDRNSEQHHFTELPASDWGRLRIITTSPQ